MSQFGKRLKELRTAAGLDRAEVARRVGVTASHVYSLESGRAPVTLAMLQDLAVAVPMSADDRADLTIAWSGENRRFRVDIEDAQARRVVARLVVGLSDLTDDDLNAISDVLDRRAA